MAAYYLTYHTFVKRDTTKEELDNDIYGCPCVDPYSAERVRIHAANLRFIATHTTIPVPKLLGLWQDPGSGLWYLKTERVRNAIELMQVEGDRQAEAVARVEEQLQTSILPQLRALCRDFMGCADPSLPVVPPHRFWKVKDTRIWMAMPKEQPEYVFCHTDLGRQNILVDPETFAIVSIIDWETAGFFPASWELPYWQAETPQERYKMGQANREAELASIDAVMRRGPSGVMETSRRILDERRWISKQKRTPTRTEDSSKPAQ